MDELSGARRLRQPGYNRGLHLTAVISVITGAALLAAAAFLLSYARIHEIALTARVSPPLAALYPLIFDATLVIACVAALALRGAPWWMRYSAVLIIMILLAVVAIAEALHSAGVSLPQHPTAAALAAEPWVLFLIAFGLGLLVLKYQRRIRAVARTADPVETLEPPSRPDARKPASDQRNLHSARWNTEDDATHVRIIPAEPKPPSPIPEPKRPSPSPSRQAGSQDARLTSAPANGHRHGHGHGPGHGHQHRSGPLD
jgi:Protein of unknown function (DUF2637)